MLEKYFVKNKDTTVGHILVNSKEKRYVVNKSALASLPVIDVYPIGIFPAKIEFGSLNIDTEYCPSEKDIYSWLKDRIFPRDRQGSNNLLKALGVLKYDIWDIAVKTKAATYMDNFWLTVNENESFEHSHPRGKFYSEPTQVTKKDGGPASFMIFDEHVLNAAYLNQLRKIVQNSSHKRKRTFTGSEWLKSEFFNDSPNKEH